MNMVCWLIHWHLKLCVHILAPHLSFLNVGSHAIMCVMGIPIGWVGVFCLVCMMRAGGVDSFQCWDGRFGFRLGGRTLQLVQVQF